MLAFPEVVMLWSDREKSVDPHIVCIERLWRDAEGQQFIYGIWFYRPKETYHLATRKFLEKVCSAFRIWLIVSELDFTPIPNCTTGLDCVFAGGV